MKEETQRRSMRQSATTLRPVMEFLRPYRLAIAGALIALIFTAATTLSIGQGLRMIIDQGFASGSTQLLDHAVVIFAVMIVLLALGTFTRFYLVSWIGERVSADIRKAVFDHVIDLHPSFFETNGSGEIQSRITTDTTLLQTIIGSSVSIALRNFLMFIGGVIWLFITNPKLSSIVIIAVPVVVVPILIFGRRVRTLSRSSQDKVADLGSYVGEALHNIKTVQAFNHQQIDKQIFGDHVESAFNVAIKRIKQRSFLTTAVIILVLGAIAAMLWVGGHDVIAGKISAGELAAFVFYAVMVAGSVGAISEVMGDVQRAAGAMERLLELMQAENLIQEPAQPQRLPQNVQGELRFADLTFAYPSRLNTPAIDRLNLLIPAGKSMALVGSSGAGKSTLFDLLLRFYDPQSGEIFIDGTGIHSLAPDTLRSQIAIVPQNPTLFTGNVMENIRYGKPDATDEEVITAAKAAYAHEFVMQLPEGYHSELGEMGVRLSGGQKQRVAIARAILRDPRILLLDEATSALDAESEHVVQEALELLMHNRTTLVIAHRLATVINVDSIVVLDNGRIVDQGTHRSLQQSSDLYRRWVKLQFDENLQDEPSVVQN